MKELNFDFIIGDGELSVVLDALRDNPDCQKISLQCNAINAEQAEQFFTGLLAYPHLEEIHIANNAIGQVRNTVGRKVSSQGVQALANYVQASDRLRVLDVRANHIGEDLAILAAAIDYNHSLIDVNLSSNPLGPSHNIALQTIVPDTDFIDLVKRKSNLQSFFVGYRDGEEQKEISAILHDRNKSKIIAQYVDGHGELTFNAVEKRFLKNPQNQLDVLVGFTMAAIENGKEFDGYGVFLEAVISNNHQACYQALVNLLQDDAPKDNNPFSDFNACDKGKFCEVLSQNMPRQSVSAVASPLKNKHYRVV